MNKETPNIPGWITAEL